MTYFLVILYTENSFSQDITDVILHVLLRQQTAYPESALCNAINKKIAIILDHNLILHVYLPFTMCNKKYLLHGREALKG